MTDDESRRGLWVQRAAVLLGAAVYLYVFRTKIPSGDALVYLSHVRDGLLVLNPNHLLMDPLAYVWCQAAWSLGIPGDGIVALKLLSAVGTLVSLLLFDLALTAAGVRPWYVRLAAVAGLFSSKYFLTMAVSEEFFMVQMPLLIAALWILVVYTKSNDRAKDKRLMLGLGVLLAAATTVSINNGALLIFLAIALLLSRRLPWSFRLRNVGLLAAGAAAVGFPAFISAYILSDAGVSFTQWLTAYQGDADNPIAGLYGIELTPVGVLISLSRLGFNFFANFAEFGPLGTVLKAAVFGEPLEMRVSWLETVLGIVCVALIASASVGFLNWLLRGGKRLPIARFGIAWIFGFCVFNFYWNDSSDQFWFQLLPVLWLLLLFYLGAATSVAGNGNVRKTGALVVMLVAVPALLVLNTTLAIGGRVFVDMERYQAQHRRIIDVGDLEVIPGWDELRWLAPTDAFPDYDQLTLMDLVTDKTADGEPLIETLPDLVHARLAAGRRVFVARLYDLDESPRPWDHLRELDWPRERIQGLLSAFEAHEVQTIGGVTIRELREKP